METENSEKTGFLHSNTARMLMVGFLTLVLLIPLELVKNLINERAQRQNEVVSEIGGKWGQSVYFYGPIIKIPYRTYSETVTVNQKTSVATTQKSAETKFAYFFPEVLNNSTSVTTKALKRNNYESVVYSTQMKFGGSYVKPDFTLKNIPDADIDWEKATVIIRTTNLRSIRDEMKMDLGGSRYTFEPSYDVSKPDSLATLETGYINSSTLRNGKIPFRFSMKYNGSRDIRIVPIGKTTSTHMISNWGSPKFSGGFLPDSKKVSDKGFSADWKIYHINRPFPQQSFGVLPELEAFAFGVDFFIPVNEYQQNDRAAKYGFLVIGLTFLLFFLIQMISKIRIHIFHYSMIGLALVMFYTLLISITEHSSFLKAYLIAGISVVVMITLYSISILKSRKFPILIGASLTALYSFIYVIIQLEDYALLFGSIGLFLILGAVMYFSRKIDWN